MAPIVRLIPFKAWACASELTAVASLEGAARCRRGSRAQIRGTSAPARGRNPRRRRRSRSMLRATSDRGSAERGLSRRLERPEGGLEVGLADRLGEIAVEAGGQAALAIALHGVGRQRDDRHVAAAFSLALANRPERLEAVHLGHLQVHQDDVEAGCLERGEGRAAVRGDDHAYDPDARACGRPPSG